MFAVTLDRAATSPVTVDFRTIDGTAKAGIDYLATTGTLTFAPGEMTKQVHVDVAGDTRAEPQEALTLALVNPVGATLLDDAATGIILDDDTGTTAPTSASAVEFKVNDNWGSGFVGQMTLKPTAALDGWTVTFDAAFAISNIWNAEIVSRTDNHYVVRNAAWNGKVGAGAEVTFGFQAAPGGAAPNITAIALNGLPVGHHQPTPDPTPPTITVGNVTVLEGNGGMGGAVDGWLSTAGNQIVDAAGQPVKLAGVNWFGFESTNASPHGVWTRSYTEMMDQMKALGFNTIRLPFATDTLHATTASGIDYSKNPDLAGLTPLQIMDKVVAYAGQIGLKIILDHHRSSLGAGTSDNGLWHDNAHSEAQWIADWKMLANRYADQPAVIGADLHNEPHAGTWGGGGANDWAAAAERAGNAIGEVNQNWLILVEGVGSYQGNNYWWGGNLMGVRDRPIALDVPNKLVYSAHDYGNSVYAQPWFQGPDFAKNLPAKFDAAWGYIFRENIAPVLVGEFGTKLQDPKDAPWLEALTSYLAGDFNNDGTSDLPDGQQGISWTYWSWNPNSTDTGGILADDWRTVNANKMAYLQPIQFDMEGGGGGMSFATFTITLSAASAQAVSVVYRTVPGEAGANDFAATSGTLTFAPGETSKTVRVAITGDKAGEANERFGLVLSDPMGATLGTVQGTATIIDDDASGTGTLSIVRGSAWGAEGTGGSTPFTFEVTRSGSAAGTAGADWAVTGGSTAAGTTNANASDFAAGSLPTGHVTFAPGETTKTITLQVSADSIVELNDSFTVTLSNPEPGVALGTASAAGVILNDDAAPSSTLSISRLNATHSEGTGAASGFTFQVTRSGSTAGTASANWSVSGGDVAGTIATNGADFVGGTLPKGVVTFSPGETSRLVTVQIAGDTVIEVNESFKVTLSGAPAGVTIGTAAATAIVYNDDTPGSGTLAIKGANATRTEGASGATPFTFQVTRSGDVGGTATADWTVTGGTVAGTLAVSGSDFTGGVLPSGRISFASGETTRTVTVNVAADRSAELNESFTISLSGAQAGVSIGTASAIGIIYNDDFASTARTESLAGTDSADVFLLGGGLDTVAGKGGTDLFLFQPASLGLAAAQATVLSDFTRSVGEKIDLSAIDAIAGTTINDAFAFIGNAAFNGTAGQLRWQDLGGGTLVVQGNVNADTAADLTVYVKAAGPIDASWFAL
jgi:aryl-phospho-beta-D-glucosidase BglC (GH1 family)